jgi:hypothetical protein
MRRAAVFKWWKLFRRNFEVIKRSKPPVPLSSWSLRRTVCSTFSRSWWSVVRSVSLAKGGTSKKRPSPHLHKITTRSNKVSPRNSQTSFVYRPIYLFAIKFNLLFNGDDNFWQLWVHFWPCNTLRKFCVRYICQVTKCSLLLCNKCFLWVGDFLSSLSSFSLFTHIFRIVYTFYLVPLPVLPTALIKGTKGLCSVQNFRMF